MSEVPFLLFCDKSGKKERLRRDHYPKEAEVVTSSFDLPGTFRVAFGSLSNSPKPLNPFNIGEHFRLRRSFIIAV
jgi:hypothetical protein